MPVLSDRKIEIVRTLVEAAPDRIVGGLQRALAETGGESALAPVRQLVEAEAADRILRNAVFLPVAPLCVGDGTTKDRLTFPAKALALTWRGLKATAPQEVEAATHAAQALASAMAAQQRLPDPTQVFDRVVAAAAQALRAAEVRDFRAVAELCDKARPNGAQAFGACLDISPVVRRAIPRLHEWVEKPATEVSAAARLAFKDAVAIDEDGGPRFFEMLGGHIAPSWMVLRIISAVMDKPTERYLHDSELGGFAERVLDEIDAALKAIGKLDLDAGPAAGREAAESVGRITEETFELEVCMELYKDHGWGKRIFEQKKTLAGLVERILKDAEKLVGQALPVGASGFGRTRKSTPRFENPPDPRAVGRAATALAFAQEVRPFAGHGGFSASHSKIMEKLGDSLEHYVEEAIDIARHGHAEAQLVQAYLIAAAELARFIRDERAAELIRRRAATATPDEPEKSFVEI
jgi:hypothetical protein